MDTLPRDLLQEIECPVCMDLMMPPITQCENGHNICSKCKPNLENCPSCRAELTAVRNLTAESLSRRAKHPCRNHSVGCKEELLLDIKEIHEQHCCYQRPKCPFNIVGKCCSEVNLAEMKEHILSVHTEEGDIREVTEGRQSFGLTGYSKCSDMRGGWWQAVFTLGQVFFLYSTVIENLFYVCYMHVGSSEAASNFKYRVTLTTSDGAETASMCLVCPSFLQFMQEGFRNASCAVFPVTFASNCVTSEAILPFEYEIFISET